MDNLEKYIKENAEAFNSAELPEGHLERFIGKMDTFSSACETGKEGKTSETRRTIARMAWAFAAVAAALACIISINRTDWFGSSSLTGHHTDWFANVGNDQLEICHTYYEKVGELYDDILSRNTDGSIDESIRSIAEETIPLVDQLPDEMDPETRALVLKEYYSDLLDGLERIQNLK